MFAQLSDSTPFALVISRRPAAATLRDRGALPWLRAVDECSNQRLVPLARKTGHKKDGVNCEAGRRRGRLRLRRGVSQPRNET
jgi:hypothetical protein